MSYSKLINLIDTASQGTLINDVYYTHRYDKISDQERQKDPFMWVDITQGSTEFSESSVMFDTWSMNCKLFLGDGTGKSKGVLTKDEAIEIEKQLDYIRSQFTVNLRDNADIDTIEVTVNTNFPMFNNGAIVWVLDVTARILNDNDTCHEC